MNIVIARRQDAEIVAEPSPSAGKGPGRRLSIVRGLGFAETRRRGDASTGAARVSVPDAVRS